MLEITNLYKSYVEAGQSRVILNNLSITLEQGHSLSIQGSSGSGKSTLLHLIAGLDKPDSGTITITGNNRPTLNIHDLEEHQADNYRKTIIGIIFQRFNLIDCINVIDNISLPAKLNKPENKQIDNAYISNLIAVLGLSTLQKKMPTELSGGEQQRVAIARALSHKPAMVLADEPTGNLDNATSNTVSDLLYSTCKSLNTSLIVVTHSPSVANMANNKVYLSNGKLEVIS